MTKPSFLISLSISWANLFAQHKVQFIVEDLSLQKHDSIYIAGTFTEWAAINSDYLLKPLNKQKKSIILNLPTGKHEYKFTRGDWLSVEKSNYCVEIENRKINVHSDTIVYVTIPFWRDECTTEHLQKVLEIEKIDTNKVNLLLAISASLFERFDIKTARWYANEALSLSEKIGYGHGKEDAYLWLGFSYSAENNYPEARKLFFSCIKEYQENGEGHLSGRPFLEIAETYWKEENYAEALRYSYSAIKLLEETGDEMSILLTYLRIGAHYETEGNFSEALKHYYQALELAEKIGAGGLGKSSAGLANKGLATAYTKLGRYKEALKKDSTALKIFQELGPQYTVYFCETLMSLADIFKNEGDIAFASGNKTVGKIKFAEASKNYLSSIKYWGNVHAFASLAKIKISLHDLASARKYLQLSLKLAKANESKNDLEESYGGLVALDSAEGNFSQAFEHYKMYILYRDSIHNKENTEKTTGIKMQYQFDKKEAIAKAEQEKKDTTTRAAIKNQKIIRNFSIVLAFLILTFSGYGFYRYKKKKQVENQQALMNERLRISRELHDEVGATLSGIAMYSHVAKQQIKHNQTAEIEKSLSIMQQSSGEMVNKLNDIVWLINPNQDSLQKLVERLEEYARDMGAIKNMQVKITVPDKIAELNLPIENRRNIYLFCKEAINNAVKYSNGSLLELTVKEVDNKLEFSVSDNGKGFDAVMVRRGNGLANMQKRADEIGAKLILHSKLNEGALVSMQCKITQ